MGLLEGNRALVTGGTTGLGGAGATRRAAGGQRAGGPPGRAPRLARSLSYRAGLVT